jgi:hypothetical protein
MSYAYIGNSGSPEIYSGYAQNYQEAIESLSPDPQTLL